MILRFILCGLLLGCSPGLLTAAERKVPDPLGSPIEWKIQLGPLYGSAPSELARPGEKSQRGDSVLGALSVMYEINPYLSVGPGFEICSLDFDVGGQLSGASTWSWLLHLEVRHPELGWERWFSPYAIFSLGWDLNDGKVKTVYPLPGAPSGAAKEFTLDDALALRAGVGIEHLFGSGLIVGLEAAWRYDRAGFRIRYYDEPDRTGTVDLSGLEILAGIRLLW